jgi:Topoisomerase 6 subunit A/Spo11, Toprim domain
MEGKSLSVSLSERKVGNSDLVLAEHAAAPDFQKSSPALASSPEPSNFKFEREDWTLFRTVEGLQQKAGVPAARLRRLVLKEIADNALDTGTKFDAGQIDGHGFYVADNGPGIDGAPKDIARLFSIARPLISTKLLRLPTRGALGNGLRIVAGAVLASEGSLVVITRNCRIALRPERDGSTTVVEASAIEHPIGTRIEISFGPALPSDQAALSWAQIACHLAQGTTYGGRSSPWWYDLSQFHELLYASGDRPVRELIANLDGCTGAKAGEIVAVAGLSRAICKKVTRDQATMLLQAARDNARPVKPERLGAVGPDAFPHNSYAMSSGAAEFGLITPLAEIPFVVEMWAGKSECPRTALLVCVNRTPITGTIDATRDKRDIDAFGCGLSHTIAQAPVGLQFSIVMNLITAYMPITSDGKEPNLRPFLDVIRNIAGKVVRKAHRPTSGDRTSQKDIVLENLDAVIADVSGGRYRFGQRQLLYGLRPIIRNETGETLQLGNFTAIVTEHEAEHGEIPLMYREPRGSIYHPHRGETITLGTLMVEEYERPLWTFNKLLYIEKEGFSEALKDVRWGERHDCALLSSKGFSTRAARDLVDKLAEHDEAVEVFCAHDADGPGTMIYQTFQEATKARGARKIKIINLGLEPWEAIEMGLEVEDVEIGKKRKPVADYVLDREDLAPNGTSWEEWLQTHRIELNAMTTPQFIEWLDGKLAAYGKLVPPPDVLEAGLHERIEDKVRATITERILREANIDAQVAAALAKIETPDADTLAEGIVQLFGAKPDAEWRDHIEAVAIELADAAGNEDAS